MNAAPVRRDVSVIVSAYQSPLTLQWVLRGLRRQTVLPAEVLVADDGSNPPLDAAVRAIAADLPFRVIHVWQPHEGFRAARSRNNAIHRAAGPILGFLDQDTIPHASWLAAHLAALRPHSVCLARTFPLTEEDARRLCAEKIDSGEFEQWQYPHLVRKLRREQRKYRVYALMRRARLPFKPTRPSLSSGNICAWREDLAAVNGFDEAYVGWGQEDDDLGRRLYMSRVRPIPLLTAARVTHVWHPLRHDTWRTGANLQRYRQPLLSSRCAQGLDGHPHADVIVVRGHTPLMTPGPAQRGLNTHRAGDAPRPATRARFILVAVLAVAATCCPVAAERGGVAPVFNRTVVLPEMGMTAVVMPDAVECPLAPPTAYTYMKSGGRETTKVDLYSPRELWIRSQHTAEWRSPGGTSLRLATLTCLPPSVGSMEHAELRDIETALRRASAAGVTWTPELLAAWVTLFTGARVASVTESAKAPTRFSELWDVQFAADTRMPIAILFRFNRRHIGLTRAPEGLYMACLLPAPGSDRAACREALLQRFLPSLAPADARSTARTTPSGTGARAREPLNPAAGLDESRRQATESIRNMRGWWCASTDHYVILSNLDERRRSLIRDLQQHLEGMRGAYERLIPPARAFSEVSVVRVFSSGSEYAAYVPQGQQWTSGLWMPAQRELVVRPDDDDSRTEQRALILSVAAHEAFHQYLHYAFDRQTAPAWFNEGHASLFENSAMDRSGKVTFLESRTAVEILQKLANGGAIELSRFTDLSYEAFYEGDSVRRSAKYATAWGLVYYLRKAAPSTRNGPYADVLDGCIEALAATDDPRQVTAKAFANVDLQALSRDFSDFWLSTRRRSEAQRFDPFAARR